MKTKLYQSTLAPLILLTPLILLLAGAISLMPMVVAAVGESNGATQPIRNPFLRDALGATTWEEAFSRAFEVGVGVVFLQGGDELALAGGGIAAAQIELLQQFDGYRTDNSLNDLAGALTVDLSKLKKAIERGSAGAAKKLLTEWKDGGHLTLEKRIDLETLLTYSGNLGGTVLGKLSSRRKLISQEIGSIQELRTSLVNKLNKMGGHNMSPQLEAKALRMIDQFEKIEAHIKTMQELLAKNGQVAASSPGQVAATSVAPAEGSRSKASTDGGSEDLSDENAASPSPQQTGVVTVPGDIAGLDLDALFAEAEAVSEELDEFAKQQEEEARRAQETAWRESAQRDPIQISGYGDRDESLASTLAERSTGVTPSLETDRGLLEFERGIAAQQRYIDGDRRTLAGIVGRPDQAAIIANRIARNEIILSSMQDKMGIYRAFRAKEMEYEAVLTGLAQQPTEETQEQASERAKLTQIANARLDVLRSQKNVDMGEAELALLGALNVSSTSRKKRRW
jgi:hypothetical protein